MYDGQGLDELALGRDSQGSHQEAADGFREQEVEDHGAGGDDGRGEETEEGASGEEAVVVEGEELLDGLDGHAGSGGEGAEGDEADRLG